jgi:hypothetical protein
MVADMFYDDQYKSHKVMTDLQCIIRNVEHITPGILF